MRILKQSVFAKSVVSTPLAAAILALAAAILALASPIPTASAQGSLQTNQFKAEGWAGGAYSSATTGEFSYCVASTTYDTGTQLAFVLYGTNVLQLMLANADWALGNIPEYDINIQVDDALLGAFTARSTREDTLLIQFGKRKDLLAAFSHGKYLAVNSGPDALVFQLANTQGALQQLRKCVATGMKPPVTRNPFTNAQRNNPFASSP